MRKFIFATVLAGALGLFAGAAPVQAGPTASQVLFGITFLKNQLIRIDPATGVGTLVMNMDKAELGYGLTTFNGDLYTFSPTTNTIDRLSMVDGRVLSQREIGVTDLAGEGDVVIGTDGVGYLASAFDSDGSPTHPVYSFDLNAGTSVRLGSTSVALDGLALDPMAPNTLYALGQGDSGDADPATVDTELYTVNKITGVLTPVGPIGVPQNSPVAGLTFSPDGILYAAIDDKLYTLNTTTGAATIVDAETPDFSFSSVSGITFGNGASVLANLSSRADVLTDDNVLIAGFIVTSEDGGPVGMGTTKLMVLRGLGPSLSVAGVPIPGSLSDPTLSLHDSQGNEIATNDDWEENSAADQTVIENAGLAPSNPKESVIVADLPEGEYTAVLSGTGGGTGIALVESYDINEGNGLKTGNLSARALVAPGDDALISGMIVEGSLDKRSLIRGLGPSLEGKVPDPLTDPLLMAYDANGTLIETNDSWMDSPEVADIMASGLAPTDPNEAVIDRIFAPGSYTVVLTGGGDTEAATGIAMIEVYDRE